MTVSDHIHQLLCQLLEERRGLVWYDQDGGLRELAILGDIAIQGNIKGLTSILEPLPVSVDNGAIRALVPGVPVE